MRDHQILDLLEQSARGGVATPDIARHLDVSMDTTQRGVARLIAAGVLERPTRGLVRIAGRTDEVADRLLDTGGRRIHLVLTEANLPAYVTGLDVIGHLSNQSIRAFPHLVVSTPDARAEVAWALADAGLEVLAPTRSRPFHPQPGRTVILRTAKWWDSAHYAIRDRVAPPHVAWIDLYREATHGRYPITGPQLGAILAEITKDERTRSRLGTLARRHAFSDVLLILDGGTPIEPYAAKVAVGYAL